MTHGADDDPRAKHFAALLAAAQAGAGWGSTTLWIEYSPAVTAFLTARGSREPEDLTSEVFLDVFERLPQFIGNESQFRSFVFSVAYRRLVDEFRKRARRGESVEWNADHDSNSAPSAEEEVLSRLQDETTLSLLNSLPTDQRDVMVLRIVADLTVAQIATVIGKRPGAVKALQRRALERLRKKVSPTRIPARLSSDGVK
ncbi:RNA polymerase sigma factor [Rhodoglobus sp.]